MSIKALQIASSALMAQRATIEVASHNIANVNTPGYVRRSILLSPVPGEQNLLGASSGRGVTSSGILRMSDALLEAQIEYETGQWGAHPCSARTSSSSKDSCRARWQRPARPAQRTLRFLRRDRVRPGSHRPETTRSLQRPGPLQQPGRVHRQSAQRDPERRRPAGLADGAGQRTAGAGRPVQRPDHRERGPGGSR